MVRFQPLLLILCLGLASSMTLAATDMKGTASPAYDDHTSGEHSRGNTAGEDSNTNNPGGTQDNDSSDTSTNSDAADGTTGGSNNTGEATGTGAGSSGGTAEDQDSR